jgi:hypothetical protein
MDAILSHTAEAVKMIEASIYGEERRSTCCGAKVAEVNDFEICTVCLDICGSEPW